MSMFWALWPVWLGTAVLLVFSTYVFLQTPARYWLKFVMIPTSMLSAVGIVFCMFTALGYPYPSALPDSFTPLGYMVHSSGGTKETIDVWIDGRPTRLYSEPWTELLEMALSQAMEMQHDGGYVVTHKAHGASDAYVSNLILPDTLDHKGGE